MGLSGLDHELVHVSRGPRSAAYTIIAVHSTKLGPALGGCRMTTYGHPGSAVADALRLSAGMTFKAAVAGVGLGGGKGVICVEPGAELTHELRDAMLLDFADAVELIGGRYITAEDVGTAPTDMRLIASRTDHVVGLPESLGGLGDPSPYTALGVHAAIRACVAHRFGSADLAGRSAAVVGAGHVGDQLARMLAADDARVIVSDIDERKRALAEELDGAAWMSPEQALLAEVDVLAPCALGGVLDEATVPALRARIVCGAANNQLAHDALAEDLARRGILYAPDFVANAGGLVLVGAELAGADRDGARSAIRGIEDVMEGILGVAEQHATTPLAAAYEIAQERLAAPAGVRA
ncbi:MAG TPA: Glu/Leu/Phe/Val dehydrogenase dimerization domain-containing protein [Solirubrobacteraceae bacterium]|nr:Glu/Leu/Phe/Val dehydrogenase dimerization domain-containing protein [Solirubrobacteraceae bacterium]